VIAVKPAFEIFWHNYPDAQPTYTLDEGFGGHIDLVGGKGFATSTNEGLICQACAGADATGTPAKSGFGSPSDACRPGDCGCFFIAGC